MSLSEVFVLGQWTVHPAHNQLSQNQTIIKLKHKQMQLLLYLIEHVGEEVSQDAIFDSVWPDRVVTRDVLSVAISQIRKALGDSAREPNYIQTIPGFGYKLIAHVEGKPQISPNIDSAPIETHIATPINKATATSKTKRPFIILLSLFVALIALSYGVYNRFFETAQKNLSTVDESQKVIAVLPLQNLSKNNEATVWGNGLTDNLMLALAGNSRLRVISRASTMSINLSKLSQAQIVEKLKTDVLLKSTIIRTNEQLELSLHLVEGGNEISLLTHQFTGDWADNSLLLTQVTDKTITLVEKHLLAVNKKPVSVNGAVLETENSLEEPLPQVKASITGEVIKLYHQANVLLSSNKRQSVQTSMSVFQQVLELAPDFGRAYTGIAAAKFYLVSETVQKLQANRQQIDDLIDKALLLTPNQSKAFSLKARLAFLYDWDFVLAEQYFAKALALNPSAAQTHFQYAQFLLAMSRFKEALQHVRQGQRLDPLAYSIPIVAWIHNMSRNYKAAKAEMDNLIPIDPNSLVYHLTAQNLYENMGDDEKAFKHYLKIFILSGYSDDDIQQAIMASGHTGLKGLNRWLAYDKQEEANVGQYQLPLSMARYLTKANKIEEALDWLEKAVEVRQVEVLWANIDPKYDVLRKNPRFIAAMAKIGFDSAAEKSD